MPRPDTNTPFVDKTFVDAFKAQFLEHIQKVYDANDTTQNQPKNLITQAVNGKGDNTGKLSRLFDALIIDTTDFKTLEQEVNKAGGMRPYILPTLKAAANCLIDDKNQLKQEVIDAINTHVIENSSQKTIFQQLIDSEKQSLQKENKNATDTDAKEEITRKIVSSIASNYSQALIKSIVDATKSLQEGKDEETQRLYGKFNTPLQQLNESFQLSALTSEHKEIDYIEISTKVVHLAKIYSQLEQLPQAISNRSLNMLINKLDEISTWYGMGEDSAKNKLPNLFDSCIELLKKLDVAIKEEGALKSHLTMLKTVLTSHSSEYYGDYNNYAENLKSPNPTNSTTKDTSINPQSKQSTNSTAPKTSWYKNNWAIGAGLVGVMTLGTLIGAAVGAVVGTIAFPGLGTAAGATIGAGIGGHIGLFATDVSLVAIAAFRFIKRKVASKKSKDLKDDAQSLLSSNIETNHTHNANSNSDSSNQILSTLHTGGDPVTNKNNCSDENAIEEEFNAFADSYYDISGSSGNEDELNGDDKKDLNEGSHSKAEDIHESAMQPF